MERTEDELRALIKSMLDGMAKEERASSHGRPMAVAIDAIHNSRKRHPVEWPQTSRG